MLPLLRFTFSQAFYKLTLIGKSALFCIVSLYSAVFWNVTPLLNQCMEITIKFWGKFCMEWKSHLKYFSWYKVELCIIISTWVIGVLVNQNEGKFKGNFKYGNWCIPAV
jgi:hypothetical protein